MCGIAGLVSSRGSATRELLHEMTERIASRGPDSFGEWVSDEGWVGFGHRRLSIMDLSEAGQQPMHSQCGRYTITYNGEIYNLDSIRRELEASGKAPSWRGHSDTEVLLAAISAWGLNAALLKISGMFAFGLYDSKNREVILARDRFGEKPLYYGWTRSGFAFASTLGPIKATPGFDNPISTQALAGLMARAYVPAPLSIHRRIFKLPPGCTLTMSENVEQYPSEYALQIDSDGPARLERYFDYSDQIIAGSENPIDNETEALEALEAVLTKSVGRQLVADVPVGTFLSGGIDSSLITSIAQRSVAKPIHSFTIGFSESSFDESAFAKKVAKAIGTDHHELYVTPQDALNVIPLLPSIYDEPFADSSQIPTYLVSKFARSEVTVSLSGDAGDELFGGYNRHQQLPRLWRAMSAVPRPMSRLALNVGAAIPASTWNRVNDLARRRRSNQFGERVQHAIRLMARSANFDTLFDSFMDDWALQGSPLAGQVVCEQRLKLDPRLKHLPLELQIMHADTLTYLPDDILTKVDRATMGASLESRIPFLDPEVTALAARISPRLKFANGGGKDILKTLLYRHVPRELVDRPKAGFAIPVGAWMRGPLRDWAEDLLSAKSLGEEGLFDVGKLRSYWESHLSGHRELTQPIWAVLMYQAWQRQQR